MRIRNPKTTALIFSSGKMVCTGAKTEALAREAARKYAKVIIKLGFPAQFKDFKIQNMVGSCDVQFPIRLEGLAWQHGHFAQYEPELFPGLIYRMQMPKIVLLIFVLCLLSWHAPGEATSIAKECRRNAILREQQRIEHKQG